MKKTMVNLPNAELKFYKAFFSNSENINFFDSLQKHLAWQEREIILFGKKIMEPRLVAFYGDLGIQYQYSKTTFEALAWNDALIEIKERLFQHLGMTFNSCLCNYYRDGQDSMGWHQDNEPALGQNPTIVSVSFGEERIFQLKHITDKTLKENMVLTNGSVLVMAGETQHFYKHAIAKTTKSIGPRINLTFRNIIR